MSDHDHIDAQWLRAAQSPPPPPPPPPPPRRRGHGCALSLLVLILVLAGVLFIDITGSLWLSWQSHIKLTAALMSNLAFIPGDLIKAGVAVAVARQLRRVPALNLG